MARSDSIRQSATRRSYDPTLQSTSNIAATTSRSSADHRPVRAAMRRAVHPADVGSPRRASGRGEGAVPRETTTRVRRSVPRYRRCRRAASPPGRSRPPPRGGGAPLAQPALVPEVAIDRPFVDSGALGDGPDRQSLPIPDGRLVQQLGASGDDPLTRFGGFLPAERPVVGPARRKRSGRLRLAGGTHGVHSSIRPSRSASPVHRQPDGPEPGHVVRDTLPDFVSYSDIKDILAQRHRDSAMVECSGATRKWPPSAQGCGP